jgi:hypothetical protein
MAMTTNFSIYLDFLIAIVFTLGIGSIILSTLFELFAYYMKLRAKFLRQLVNDVLNDKDLNYNYSARFYDHPQIDLTKKNYRSLPQYISALNFAQTLIHTIVHTHEIENEKFTHKGGKVIFTKIEDQDQLVKRFKSAVDQMNFSDLKLLLSGFISSADANKEDLVKNIGFWYDEYTARAAGWYKVKAQRIMMVMAIVGCFALNVDIFRISKVLIHDPALAAHIADIAENYSQETIKDVKETINGIDQLSDEEVAARIKLKQKELGQYMKLLDEMYKQNAPVGWQSETLPSLYDDQSGSFWFWKFLGCLLAATALALGAPFWFDVLNKLVNLRTAGKKPGLIKSQTDS